MKLKHLLRILANYANINGDTDIDVNDLTITRHGVSVRIGVGNIYGGGLMPTAMPTDAEIKEKEEAADQD